jgi:LemA protein
VTILIILIALAALVLIWGLFTYNRLVSLKVSVDEGASEIDVQLKRRHDLIPNLVETVKGYAKHERETFQNVTEARGQAISARGTAQRSKAEGALSEALGRLLAVAEDYPDLKANENFLELQRELAATEDRIQAARRFYNNEVESLNARIGQVPTNVVARIGGFKTRDFFVLPSPAEGATPQVSFS